MPRQALQRDLVLRERQRRHREEQAARLQTRPAPQRHQALRHAELRRGQAARADARLRVPRLRRGCNARSRCRSRPTSTSPKASSPGGQRFGTTSGATWTTTATARWTSSPGSRTGAITAGTTATTPGAIGRTALHGFVLLHRNLGTNAAPRYAPPVKVEAGGKPIDTFGCPSPNFADFDGDGDLDLICGEFLDGFTYFENVGTRMKPVYAAGPAERCSRARLARWTCK
ncbi:MAG: hypothetical protein U0797_04405 [Gemmataceae bacterium]